MGAVEFLVYFCADRGAFPLMASNNTGREYREQALKLYPWICGRCAREFTASTLSGLTVHHKDHNHDHNPADGSNWELLCLYCHDNEHQRELEARRGGTSTSRTAEVASGKPFGDLKELLARKTK